jgi:ATP-dependent DNA ligase
MAQSGQGRLSRGKSVDAGRVVLRSRNGTRTAPAFPEAVAATAQLPDPSAFDGELIVWESGRLAISRLQDRLRRRGAARAGQECPAHFVAFDLLRLSGTDTTGWSCRRRRAALDQSRGRRCRGWARRGCCARRPPPR